MRYLLLASIAVFLAACGPASRLDYSQRALIQCLETGRDGAACMQQVMGRWNQLAGACGVRNNVRRVCDGEFEARYYCNTSTTEEKTTDAKGNVTTKSVEKKQGPGCNLSDRYGLWSSFMSECERHSDSPGTPVTEGASCYCGSSYCNFVYPAVSNDTAVRYFPELADK